MNKAYGRTGSLFEKCFGRIEVESPGYFTHLIRYIHHNPQKHGFVEDFRAWPWSSYHSLSDGGDADLCRDEILAWFGDPAQFAAFHRRLVDERAMVALIDADQE